MDVKRLKKYQQWLYSRMPLIAETRWRKAAQALVQLKNPQAHEELCQLVLKHDHPLVREVAIAAQ